MNKTNFFIGFALAILFQLTVTADIVKKAQVAFRFLEHPVSAEVIGRGCAGLVLTNNSNTVFYNPGGLGWVEKKLDFQLNYSKDIADISHSSFALSYNWKNIGIFAVDALFLDYGDLHGTRRADNDQGFIETGTFSPQNYAVGLSFSQKVSNRFSYGVRLKIAHEDLGEAWVSDKGVDFDDPEFTMRKKAYGKTEPAVDVGVVYDFLSHGIRFGAVIQNFSREIRYEDHKAPLPFAVLFSMSVKPLSFFDNSWKEEDFIMVFESKHPRDYREKYHIGMEYGVLNALILRAGYMKNYDERDLTFGAGLIKNYLNRKFKVDYAYQTFGIFGGVHVLSFGISL